MALSYDSRRKLVPRPRPQRKTYKMSRGFLSVFPPLSWLGVQWKGKAQVGEAVRGLLLRPALLWAGLEANQSLLGWLGAGLDGACTALGRCP